MGPDLSSGILTTIGPIIRRPFRWLKRRVIPIDFVGPPLKASLNITAVLLSARLESLIALAGG